ncbi:MAG: aromatic ring-hydroxylating dioxygenase subunit alpha, partial [Acidobacteria bacterium]
MTLKINDDITKARTLGSEFYRSEQYFIDSKEKIFARTWQFLDLTDEVEALKPFTLLEGFLDEPLLVIKDKEGFRCLSNVCT